MEAVKYILKDVSSCVLSFMLSQPVEVDVMMLVYFMLEYVGLVSLVQMSCMVGEIIAIKAMVWINVCTSSPSEAYETREPSAVHVQ